MTLTTSEYNAQQMEALLMVQRYLAGLSTSQRGRIKAWLRSYLRFRADVAAFQDRHLSRICTEKCFADRTSFCCGREGIATFFADMVINLLLSSEEETDAIKAALSRDAGGVKCVYLKPGGCLWRLKPIVCEMFLCASAKASVLEKDPALKRKWERLRRRERRYTWPDRLVLFDKLEALFMEAGYDSPLMYLHKSPGLLRVKNRSGVQRQQPASVFLSSPSGRGPS